MQLFLEFVVVLRYPIGISTTKPIQIILSFVRRLNAKESENLNMNLSMVKYHLCIVPMLVVTRCLLSDQIVFVQNTHERSN